MLSLKTIKMPWINIGTIAFTTADDDAALGVTERKLSTIKDLTNVVYKEVPTGINSIEVRFIGATADKAAQYIDVWAGRLNEDNDCDLCRVCTLVPTIGTQDVLSGTTPHYADAIAVTNNKWLKSVFTVVPGAEHMARLVFDLCGYDLVLFHGHSAAFTEDVQIEISGY